MRKIVLATAAALLCAAPVLAGPKDQTKDSLIGSQALIGNATVNNSTTAFSFAAKGCKVQIKAKGLLGTTDGDVIICLASADVIAPPALIFPAGNSVVLVGEIKKGGLGIKADLTEIGCGTQANIQYDGGLDCFLDDPLYRTSDNPLTAGSWAKACADAGMAVVPNAAADPAMLKGDPTQRVIVGLCQGFVAGNRINPPVGAFIAERGSRGLP